MHSDHTDRIRQAEAYYRDKDRFAPGEEEAIAKAKARREAQDAITADAALASVEQKVTGQRPSVMADDVFVQVGYLLRAASAAFTTGLYPEVEGDADRVTACALGWVAEAQTRLDTDVFVEHPDIRVVYDGVVGGLALSEDPTLAIAEVLNRANPDKAPSLEATATELGIVLGAAAIGLVAFPELRSPTAILALGTCSKALVDRVDAYGLVIQHDQAATYLDAARHGMEDGLAIFG